MTFDDLCQRARQDALDILGGFHLSTDEEGIATNSQTLVLLGPREPGFWDHFTLQQEWTDGQPDPVDRWSRRVIGHIACEFGAKAYFPFGGPPYHPFYRWALRSGRTWESPVRLLVHQNQGLMVSFRGALALKEKIDLPPPPTRPCDTCAAPCLTSCPVSALGPNGYDVPKCHAFLDTPAGDPCLSAGCLVRRACPVSQGYARLPQQSAYHMARFHKTE